MPFIEDLASAFADFAATSCMIGGAPVGAIFDNAYAESMNAAGAVPTLTCRSADVTAVTRGAAVVVDGVSYTVAEIEPDGTGITLLILQRV